MTTILVVEDEPDIRELIRLNLELGGFEVVTAADGVEALETARAWRPDAIVLDVMMPRMDGWQVLARLKAMDPSLAGVPVVILTALSSDLDRVRGGIEGAVSYLTKPFDAAELRAALAHVVDGTPEPVQRRQAQHRALIDLARIEGGGAGPGPEGVAHPRLSRLEAPPVTGGRGGDRPGCAVAIDPGRIGSLSAKQRELIAAVARSATVMEAADLLDVSRSNVYASLRRICRRLGVESVSDLVSLARAGALR